MRKPEITIQYFIERGRRRTVTLSLKRLNALLITGLVAALWCIAASGYVFYHLTTGHAPFATNFALRKSVVAVGPNQPGRDNIPAVSERSDLKLAAKSLINPATEASPVTTEATSESTPSEAASLVTTNSPEPVADIPQYSIANLLRFESGLKKTQTSGPLRFRNVRISLKNDHLRINADIEKRTGNSVEGFAFIVAEYEAEGGGKYLITSHGKRDWDDAVATIKSATYFKARLRTSKRFDIVHDLNKSAKLVSLKLVAKDTITGQTVIEEITPNIQADVLGF